MTKEQHDELIKAAAEVHQELRESAVVIKRLDKLASDQKSLIVDQARIMDAYAHVFALVKEGDIDATQIDEELERILKLGLALYKSAAAPIRINKGFFGEITDIPVENEKSASTLETRELNPVEKWLDEFRRRRMGLIS